jgi:hypothetical protein
MSDTADFQDIDGDRHRVDDPEDLSQSTRIQEILDRRYETLQARDRLREMVDMKKIPEERALQSYRSRLESLILELWNLFENLESDEGKEYLASKPIASVEIPPPESLLEQAEDLPPGVSVPDTKSHTVTGLAWFLNNPPRISETFTLKSFSPPQTFTETNDYLLQWGELDNALQAALEFIDVAGVDADVTEQEQQIKITRDLLEEVEEWRQQHVNQSN